MKEDIKKWLDGDRNYDIGLILLGRYHKNRMLRVSLERRRIPDKLEYELRKISGLKEKKLKVKTVLVIAKPDEKSLPGSSIIVPGKGGKIEIIDPESRKVKKEDLPDHLQKVYDQNIENYRHARHLHEKLKLLANKNPEEREFLVQQLIKGDQLIREGWALIDNWDGKIPDPPTPTVVNHRRINANRTFITKKRQKLAKMNPKNEEQIEKLKGLIQERVNELKMAGEELAEKTIKELKELGIEA